MKTKAAVLYAPHTEYQVEDIELDAPKDGEVLVKFAASGMCHSDEHLVTGDMVLDPEITAMMGWQQFPIVAGHEGAGEITDNDILLAAASNAIVVGFNTKISDTARRAAESEKVDVRLYDIIYQLTDDIEKALGGLLEPDIIEVIEGRAEVRKLIKVGKTTVIAGSYVTDGRMVKGGARVWRGGKVIVTDKIESLRRFRDDVREVAQGFECGIGLVGFSDLQEGDVIECFTSQSVSRSLSS